MARCVGIVMNPSSGTRPTLSADVEAAAGRAGLQARVILLRPGIDPRATVLQLIREGCETIVAAGGDGTVNTVATAILGTPATLGILPVGTLNHLAKDLGLPTELDLAAAVIAEGGPAAIDVGEVNGRIFLNNSSIGIYPLLVEHRERQRRQLRRPKWRAAIVATFAALRIYPMLHVTIHVKDQTLTRRTPLVFVGNNEYVFEGLRAGSRAAIDRGCLCLLVTHARRRLALLWLALRALFGRLSQARDFDALSSGELQVHVRRRHVRVALDGEVHRLETPLFYRVRPRALRVLLPRRPAGQTRPEPSHADAAASL